MCCTHGKVCHLPTELFSFGAGFSCKSVSRLNNNAAAAKGALQLNKSSLLDAYVAKFSPVAVA